MSACSLLRTVQYRVAAVPAAMGLRMHAVDVPFWQEVAHRSVNVDAHLPFVAPSTWERLPFRAALRAQSIASLAPVRACTLALSTDALGGSTGDLFGAAHTPSDDPLANPLSVWRFIGRVALPLQRLVAVPAQSIVYAVAGGGIAHSSVLALSFVDGGGDKCGALGAVKNVLPAGSIDFGTSITGLSLDAKRDILFASGDGGAFAIALVAGTVQKLSADATTSLLYTSAWDRVFFATQLALYTFQIGSHNVYAKVAHEWIGGNLEYAPIDMAFDEVNAKLWIVDNMTAHRLSENGVWDRFGYKQRAPIDNITSVAARHGVVWVGSASKGVARLVNTDVQTKPATSDGDPWTWLYYGGARYLPSNNVYALFSECDVADSSDASVLIVTDVGLSLLNVRKWTLAQKAVVMRSFQEPRHDRYGISSACVLRAFGDVTTFANACDDNDGLWTSFSGMATAYEALATSDVSARAAAWKLFDAVEQLNTAAGNYPHYPARSLAKIGDANCIAPGDARWHASPIVPGFLVQSDTSSDELCGHLAFYPLMFDLASTEQERARVAALIDGITGAIVAHNFTLVDPFTGVATRWGNFNPSTLNSNAKYYSERGLNSLEICAFLASAYSVTGTGAYRDAFWLLVERYGYARNARNAKIDSSVDENHSDDILLWLSIHTLHYALHRLPVDHARRPELAAMVASFDATMERAYALVRNERSPLWFAIYAGTAARAVPDGDALAAAWSLRHWAVDLIDWPVDMNARLDTVVQPLRGRFGEPLMRDIRPPSERTSSQWNHDPFALRDGTGLAEMQPSIWTLPYYLMLYHDLI